MIVYFNHQLNKQLNLQLCFQKKGRRNRNNQNLGVEVLLGQGAK